MKTNLSSLLLAVLATAFLSGCLASVSGTVGNKNSRVSGTVNIPVSEKQQNCKPWYDEIRRQWVNGCK